MVFSAPERQPRSYLVAGLDYSAEEIIAQVEFRRDKQLR